jgi:Zn-dependent peptidase ImmA (M78 family)/transcriptional regulator with XRE-family HTH domain
MVILAREARGFTQSALAGSLGISQGHLSKIEAGMLPVPESLLPRLSEVLDYPMAFFSLPEPILGPGTSEFFHRMRKSISARLLARLHAQVNILRIQTSRLLRAVELDPDRIPELDPETFGGSIEDVARAVRAAWNLPPGPIVDLTHAIEGAGGIVIPTEFGTTLVDAVGRYVPGMPPLFFTIRHSPGDRQRLTLAHELGHMVMHRIPNPDMESEAFAFAAEFLMPERDIRRELERLTLDRLIALKLRWRVSMQALLTRAQHLGAITVRQARYLWMLIGKAGFRTREPAEAEVVAERPSLLGEILDLYRHTFGFSPAQIAELIAVNPHELETVWGVRSMPDEARARFRLVSAS